MTKLQELLDARWNLNSVEVDFAIKRCEFERARALFTEGYNAGYFDGANKISEIILEQKKQHDNGRY